MVFSSANLKTDIAYFSSFASFPKFQNRNVKSSHISQYCSCCGLPQLLLSAGFWTYFAHIEHNTQNLGKQQGFRCDKFSAFVGRSYREQIHDF